MKPRIVIVHQKDRSTRMKDVIHVFHDGELLTEAYDASWLSSYPQDEATKCCELLSAMHKKGLIELFADPGAFALWNEILSDCELVEDPKDVVKNAKIGVDVPDRL